MRKTLILFCLVWASYSFANDTLMLAPGLWYSLDEGQHTATVLRPQDSYAYDFSRLDIPDAVKAPNDNHLYTVTAIEEYACQSISRLTSVSIPVSATVGNHAFDYCFNLDSVAWNAANGCPENILYDIFSGDHKLRVFSFGQHVREISRHLCNNLTSLQKIYNYSLTPQSIIPQAFQSVDKSTCMLYVPMESYDLYENAVGWQDFEHLIGFDPGPGPYLSDTIAELIYQNMYGEELYREQHDIQVPHAPRVMGFKFLRWEVQQGYFSDGIILHAVYESDNPSNTPAEVSVPGSSAKLIREGNVYILQNGILYNALGQPMR